MTYSLSDLAGCFEGVVPAKMATCSRAGIPNASYLSHVYQVDDQHIATSYQFFNKTRANLLENPFASIQVRHPATLRAYRLKVKYLRSEASGPVFETMSTKLDVIAASEGMGPVFKLKAADIYQVLEIELVRKNSEMIPLHAQDGAADAGLEWLRVISDKLVVAKGMEEFFDLSLELLSRYLGWTQMILLLADHSQKTLLTHASRGYPQGGVGSEVEWGQGLIGRCAELRRPLQISGLKEGLRYAQAVKKSLSEKNPDRRIPLPGLSQPAAQMAVPILTQGELQGVFFVESETQSYWGNRDLLTLSVVTNFLGMGIRAFEGKPEVMRPQSPAEAKRPPSAVTEWRFRYVDGEDVIFVNDQYLIKNIPARILRYLLESHLSQGRTEFSNMELRADKSLQLPDLKDNLEARLILLRKRLEEKDSGLRLVSTGRGKFKLEINGRILFA